MHVAVSIHIPRVQGCQLVLVCGDLLLHDLGGVAPELLPLPRQPLPLLTVVVQEAAQVAQLLVVPACNHSTIEQVRGVAVIIDLCLTQ